MIFYIEGIHWEFFACIIVITTSTYYFFHKPLSSFFYFKAIDIDKQTKKALQMVVRLSIRPPILILNLLLRTQARTFLPWVESTYWNFVTVLSCYHENLHITIYMEYGVVHVDPQNYLSNQKLKSSWLVHFTYKAKSVVFLKYFKGVK